MKEVEENDFNLNISRYIDTLEPEKPIDVAAALDALWAAEKLRNAAEARMNALLKEMGYVGMRPEGWRSLASASLRERSPSGTTMVVPFQSSVSPSIGFRSVLGHIL